MKNSTHTIEPSTCSLEDIRLVLVHLRGLGQSQPNLFHDHCSIHSLMSIRNNYNTTKVDNEVAIVVCM